MIKDYLINNFDEVTIQTLLELEKTQRDYWNISRQTAEFLYTQIIMNNCQNALEIGTSNGYSGLWLSKALKKTGGKLLTIDYYPKRQNIAIENFERCGTSDIVTPVIGSAVQILEKLNENMKFDFIFSDANKRESVEYFRILDPHIVKGGIFACDNVISHKEKTQTFIDAINAHTDYENVVLNLPAGLAFARKIR